MDIAENFLKSIYHKNFLIKIRFKRDTTFHYFHGGKLYGLVSRILNLHPIGKEIIIDPCETGRIHYKIGEEYNFGITFLKDDPDLMVKLLTNLYNIPDSDIPGDLTNDTIELVDMQEIGLSQNPIILNKKSHYTFEFITPLRAERKVEDRRKGRRYFDPEYFDVEHFLKLLYNRLVTLARLNNSSLNISNDIPEIPPFEILEKYFIWVDMPKNNTTLGGIQGTLKIKIELDDFWLQLISLGQIVNTGKNTSFGFGKFTVNEAPEIQNRVKPVNTFLDLVLEENNLLTAFKHIKSNSDSSGIDGVTAEDYEINLNKNLDDLVEELKTGKYKTAELKGVIIPKKESKIRALAIPTIKDRVLQRAVSQVLSDSIDHLLEENSFAYRKGLSRVGAARAINNARGNGFNFILESDIQSFYDNVDWEILFKKLDILYGNDPVNILLKQWIRADIFFNGTKIKREKGLPQGSAISPLLANLYLDEFDEDLQDNFKLVRYADDFVILCKSKKQAEEALSSVKASLNKLKLELNPLKTTITSFDEGFQYLGYLFVRSTIVQKKKNKRERITEKSLGITKEIIPEGSWLTLVDFEKIKKVTPVRETNIKPLKTNEIDELLLEKYPLYINNNSFVHVDKNKIELTFEEDMEQKRAQFPLHSLNSVIISDRGRITMPAVMMLNENNIPVYFCRATGELRLTIPVNTKNYDLWIKQAEASKDDSFTLAFAKEIVAAKINNQKVLIRRLSKDDSVRKQFNGFISKIGSSESIAVLRGIEGSSAVLFFDSVNNLLPGEWKFDARSKHPPKDPFNALLSFGYTILYHHISTALQAEGLNPQISFYHKPNNRYFPLASDLQEEFRHIIDSLVLYIVRKNMVSLNEFKLDKNAKFPCLISYEFKKKFIQMVEEKLKILFKPPGTTKQITYKQFISLQAKILKTGIKKKEMNYKPLRIR